MLFSARKLIVWIVLLILVLFLFGFVEMLRNEEGDGLKARLYCLWSSVSLPTGSW